MQRQQKHWDMIPLLDVPKVLVVSADTQNEWDSLTQMLGGVRPVLCKSA